MAWLAFADALLYLLALKEMKANVYGKSFHTDTTVVHSSNHFPSKWKIRQLSAPHIDSGLRTQSDPRLQKPKSQVLGLTIQVSGSNKVTSPFITCFIHFQVSCFSSAYTTFSHFPVMTPNIRIYIP